MKQLTRRQFAAAGAGLARFTIVPAWVLGRGGATPPSDRMNLAFAGIGMRGALDLQELAALDQNVVAVCDVDWSTPAAGRGGFGRGTVPTAEKYPKAKRYDDYRKMLQEQEKNIDGVVIA